MNGKNEYRKRQTYILSSIGLFYLIIIGLFAVPLFGAFVVVLIKGLLDFQAVIIYGGAFLVVVAAGLLVRWGIRWIRRMREGGRSAGKSLGSEMERRSPFQISVLNGLLTFTYGGRRHPALPPGNPGAEGRPPALPDPGAAPAQGRGPDVISQLRELAALREEGIIDEAEFRKIKQGLLKGGPPESPGDG